MNRTLSILALLVPCAAFAQTTGQTDLADASDSQNAFELVSFVADASAGTGMAVRWTTAGEGQGMRYFVERSADRLNWRTAFSMDGEGPSNGYTNYEMTDLSPITGVSYYRLTAMRDGNEVGVSDDFAAEYNPGPALRFANGRAPGHFTVEGNGSITGVRLMNDRGQFMLMQLEYDGDQARVTAEELAPGAYYMQAVVNGKPVMRPLFVTANGVIGG